MMRKLIAGMVLVGLLLAYFSVGGYQPERQRRFPARTIPICGLRLPGIRSLRWQRFKSLWQRQVRITFFLAV